MTINLSKTTFNEQPLFFKRYAELAHNPKQNVNLSIEATTEQPLSPAITISPPPTTNFEQDDLLAQAFTNDFLLWILAEETKKILALILVTCSTTVDVSQ